MPTVRIAVPEIAIGRSKAVDVNGTPVLLCRSNTGLHALRDICPHQALSMEGGRVRANSIICPHHGARFMLDDGRSMSPLAPRPVEIFPCTEDGGEAIIEI